MSTPRQPLPKTVRVNGVPVQIADLMREAHPSLQGHEALVAQRISKGQDPKVAVTTPYGIDRRAALRKRIKLEAIAAQHTKEPLRLAAPEGCHEPNHEDRYPRPAARCRPGNDDNIGVGDQQTMATIPLFTPYWTRARIVEAVCQYMRASGGAFPKYLAFRTENGLPSIMSIQRHCGSIAVLRQLVLAQLTTEAPLPSDSLRTCLGTGCTARFPKAEGWYKCRRCREQPPEPDGAWLMGEAIKDDWWELYDEEDAL